MKFLITYSTLYHIYYQISNSTLSLKLYKHIRIISRLRARTLFLSLLKKKKEGGKKRRKDQYLTYKFSITVSVRSL